jgi:L-threonylcarbamoyladenylate synthase
MPNNLPAIKILKAVGRPLVGTSANLSTQKSAVTAEEVMQVFDNQIDLLIDKGKADIGVPSTIIDLTKKQAHILREGAIPRTLVEEILGEITL